MRRIVLAFLFLAFVSGMLPQKAWAVPSIPCISGQFVQTELGDLCTDPQSLISQFILILTGMAGGVSLLLFLAGAGKYVFSMGNPEGIEEARGTITHAVAGLLLVVLSVFIIRLIGIDILALPGLTKSGGGFSTP